MIRKVLFLLVVCWISNVFSSEILNFKYRGNNSSGIGDNVESLTNTRGQTIAGFFTFFENHYVKFSVNCDLGKYVITEFGDNEIRLNNSDRKLKPIYTLDRDMISHADLACKIARAKESVISKTYTRKLGE